MGVRRVRRPQQGDTVSSAGDIGCPLIGDTTIRGATKPSALSALTRIVNVIIACDTLASPVR